MKRQLIFVCFLIVFASCKRGNHQVVELKNSSSENIYFLISKSRTPAYNEVANIRPIISEPITEVKVEYEDKEQAKSIKQNLYRNRIERNSLETLLSSESAGIFVNAISVQSIIKNRYGGQLYVFIITENDLQKYTDKEVINKKLYKHFKTLRVEHIKDDKLTLEYY